MALLHFRALFTKDIDRENVLLLLVVASVVFLIVFISLKGQRNSSSRPDLPWVGRNEKAWFIRNIRTRLWNMMNYEQALRLAYDNYARHNRPCILATLDGDVVLLPPSSIPWMISQPEHVLSVNGAHKHILQTKYTFPRPEIMDPTVHFDVIKSELTRQVFAVTPDVCDEMAAAVDEIWGKNTKNFEDIKLFDSITKIIARTSNRVFVGLPLCRNEHYLENAIGFAEDIALSATVLRLFPGPIRSLVAPIVTYPNRKHTRSYTKILTPEILRRQQLQQGGANLEDVENDGAKASGKETGAERNDFLQWLLTRSLRKSHVFPDEADPDIICARLLHTNFASVHTTSFIGTNAILDILATPPSEGVVDKLRAEALATMDTDDESEPGSKMWSRTSLGNMHFLDSALRESSRRASIIGVGVNHKVIVPGGVTTPDGTHLPEGCMVAVHSWGLHNDEGIYAGAGGYRPFRFVELRDQIGECPGENDMAESAAKEKEKAYLDKAHLQFIATSPTYLGFGHGRHSCPGRFFAANELKLLIAYLLTRYDIHMVMEGGVSGNWNGEGVRPECFWAGPNHIPPMGAKVSVRRRSEV
ncbi:uncharacterized protein Z518_08169 [Rhinocladiella mackenziei CBS 650.93]|uniref:Cytochrome P450 n=1 Tax=Rhinocladiella mackenziei CBS 650.93 TaxID=1442369 RepID=A0A0D2J015_9EURO|nr:uncharacterized protein Z518_08169 [Rhinocladiella mackenziei CBS 650.93]KIX02230.1 hypothetical protein Z518_08169 [Rhinocladiella mackenziei CBS 650.93]